VIVKFNARANPTPSRTTHNTLLEVAWTVIPVVILVVIAMPSFRILFVQLNIPQSDLTIKATGNQWNWTYAYPDEKIEFTSIMLQDAERRSSIRSRRACSASTIRSSCRSTRSCACRWSART
jgi:cytochrome c oxidase subunit 2